MKDIALSIIIVEYKSGEYVERLLATLPKRPDWEVVVIDNSKNNVGFGAGCNVGANKARGKHLLFLNPDVLIDEKNITKLLRYLQTHKNVGVVGPKFINADRRTEQSSTRFPNFAHAFVALTFLNKLFPQNKISRDFWMRSWDRESTKKVDVVSGAAIMVRKEEFDNIGGFDESFFLYWEEFDLCKRMKIIDKDTVFVSEAIAQHPREISMKKSDLDVENMFQQSRWRYFRKHLGLFRANLLECWFFLTEQWRLTFIVGLAFFLRVVNIQHIRLIGDVGRDYLQALNLLDGRGVSLLGIPSSVPRFAQGPLNIWFDAFSFIFAGKNVFAPPLLAAVITSMACGLLYVLLKRHVGKWPSFFASMLLVTSPAAVLQSRMPFYLFAEPLFLLLYLVSLLNLKKAKDASVFFAVFTFFLLFQWELATIPLIALLLVAFTKSHIRPWQHWKPMLAGFTLGLLPQIVYDFTHKCLHLCNFGAWMGYRLIAVTGFDGRHGLSIQGVQSLITKSVQQLIQITGGELAGLFFIGLLLTIGVHKWFAEKNKNALLLYTLWGMLFLFAGLVIHGDPSEAYFPPFLILVPIVVGFSLREIPRYKKMVAMLALSTLFAFNIATLLKNSFYAQDIRSQLDAARWIITASKSNTITLRSYDSGAKFSTYLDGMRFLVKTMGGKLSENKDGNMFIVSLDGQTLFPNTSTKIYQFDTIRVSKEYER